MMTTLPQSQLEKSKELNTATTVIGIPSSRTTTRSTSAAGTIADAAVVLHVCSNFEAACLQQQRFYMQQQQQQQQQSPLCVANFNGMEKLEFSIVPAAAAAAANNNNCEKKYLADYQRCCPPPLFIILISLVEIGVFVYDYLTVQPQNELNSTSIPSESVFIYRPDRRLEIWRFISYMVLHANWFHLGFNVVIQLLYGLPLEMVHGSLRIAVIYLAGVFAGSLGTSVVDSAVYLVGASGGVYALLAAQLANIALNFRQMRYAISQLVSVVIFVSCDLGYAFYSKYLAEESKVIPSVSYIAHLTGSLAGFTMGLLVLRHFDNLGKSHTNLVVWWMALSVYLAFTIFAIVFNLINTMTAQMLEQEGEVIRQRLLHDLGIS